MSFSSFFLLPQTVDYYFFAFALRTPIGGAAHACTSTHARPATCTAGAGPGATSQRGGLYFFKKKKRGCPAHLPDDDRAGVHGS